MVPPAPTPRCASAAGAWRLTTPRPPRRPSGWRPWLTAARPGRARTPGRGRPVVRVAVRAAAVGRPRAVGAADRAPVAPVVTRPGAGGHSLPRLAAMAAPVRRRQPAGAWPR